MKTLITYEPMFLMYLIEKGIYDRVSMYTSTAFKYKNVRLKSLDECFIWANTIEGFNYWHGLHIEYEISPQRRKLN